MRPLFVRSTELKRFLSRASLTAALCLSLVVVTSTDSSAQPPAGLGGPGTSGDPGLGGSTGGGGGSVGNSGVPYNQAGTGTGGSAGGNAGDGNNPDTPVCAEASVVPLDAVVVHVNSNCPCQGGSGAGGGDSSLGSNDGYAIRGSGCSTCGGGSNSNSSNFMLGKDFTADDVSRIWIPNNRVNNSSFSPGFYSQFDSQMNIYPSSSGNTIIFFDVFAKSVYQFVDGLDGDTADGIYHDMRNYHAREIRLVDASGSLVTSASQAVSAIADHWNGTKETYGLIDLDADSTGVSLAARLTSRVDRNGRGSTVNYKSFSAAQIAESPDRQWQIDTITDSQGSTLTFAYDATQRSGRWVVSNVTRQDGADVDFQYNASALTAVVLPDGTQSTFSYGQDTVAQTATVTIYEAASGKRSLTFHLTNDYMTLSSSRKSQVINQPTGVLRMVEDAQDSVLWMRVPAADPSIDKEFTYVGGNKAIVVSQTTSSVQRVTSWGVELLNGQAEEYAGIIDIELDSTVQGGGYSTTLAQAQSGRLPSATDASGRSKQYEYNLSGYVTKITYPADGTYEEFSYNTFGQKTRQRSRTGDVSLYTYDAAGRLLTTESGLEEQNGQDTQTSAYATASKEYYPASHANAGLLKAETNPLYNSAQPTLHRTDYEYTAQGRLFKVIGPADVVGGQRPVTQFAYDSAGRLTDTIDPRGYTTTKVYDTAGRLISTIYPDSSTEQTLYSSSTNTDPGRVLKTKNRVGTVTSYSYDSAGRLIESVEGSAVDANILDGAADDSVVSDPNQKNVTQYTYLDGTTEQIQVKVNGAKTDYEYDYLNRHVATKQYPSVGVVLVNRKGYSGNELLYNEDPYGRRKYYGYRASDGTLIRTVTCTVPEFTLADFNAVWNLTRSNVSNAQYIVHDAIRDNDGHLSQIIDGRGNETRYEYDSKGREIIKLEACGTVVEAKTETIYDAAGNVIEVRSPRYFDSNDTFGYQKSFEKWTYDGSGHIATHTEAPDSPEAATESYTYDIMGKQRTHTDFEGHVWTNIDDTCCGKSNALKNPLGHGTIRNTDSAGRTVHSASVADVNDHTINMLDPLNGKTLAESSTRFDALGRTVASTTWLVPRDAINTSAPAIAGLNGEPHEDGLTTQYLYDNNLSDGVGLETPLGIAPAILPVNLTSWKISLATALNKLASTEAQGGAGIIFSADTPGTAIVVINGEHEVSVKISDSVGRTVMTANLDNLNGTANNLITWSTQIANSVANLSGTGTVRESRATDALGNSTKIWTDGAGRTLRSFDQFGNITQFTFDNAGNQLSIRDANGGGQDITYDHLSRPGLITDTEGHTTNTLYNKTSHRIADIDGKGNGKVYTFNARGRQIHQTNRIGGKTTFTYLKTGQLQSLTDAENQTTSYSFDSAGNKVSEQFADHLGGSPGDQPYGTITYTLDALGRVRLKEDQAGETCTLIYDLASKLIQREYRSLSNSLTSPTTDIDTFTYDRAGRILTAESRQYANLVHFTYDSAGRKKSESLTTKGQTFTTGLAYNAKNELTHLTYPDGTLIQRSFTKRGNLLQLTHDGSVIDTRSYDNDGRLISSHYSNGVSETRTYNTDSTLSSISFTGAQTGSIAFNWDANKNLTTKATSGTMMHAGFTVPANGYDNEDRLVTINQTEGLVQSWVLSTAGDWQSVSTNGTVHNRSHGPAHELIKSAGQDVVNDLKGNITSLPAAARTSILNSSPNPLSLAWDHNNKCSSADVDNDGNPDIRFTYDALGRRVSRTRAGESAVYVQCGMQTVMEYSIENTTTLPQFRYVYADDFDEPVLRYSIRQQTFNFYHRDHQFSIIALTDNNGTIVERYSYSAYGYPTIYDPTGAKLQKSFVGNSIMYTGRNWDSDLAMYDYRARLYDPTLGRFCSRDPIGFNGGTVSLVAYVGSRPLSHRDPSGLLSSSSIGCGTFASRTVSYRVACLFDKPGFFGVSRTTVNAPWTPGQDPNAVCLGLGVDGYAGYRTERVVTTRTKRCSPCVGGGGIASTLVCKPSLTPLDAGVTCVLGLAIGVSAISQSGTKVDITITEIDTAPPDSSPKTDPKPDPKPNPRPDPKPVDPPYFPPPHDKRDELCNCCDMVMEPGHQYTIWTNCRVIPKSQCISDGWELSYCVGMHVKNGQRTGVKDF